MRTLSVEEMEVLLGTSLMQAYEQGGFVMFRVMPGLRDEAKYPPKAGVAKTSAHFFSLGPGYDAAHVAREVEEMLLREPTDIREVIAVGKTLGNQEKVDLMIYAPTITGDPKVFLKIVRWPDWKGFGLTCHRWDDDEDIARDKEMVGFSNTGETLVMQKGRK